MQITTLKPKARKSIQGERHKSDVFVEKRGNTRRHNESPGETKMRTSRELVYLQQGLINILLENHTLVLDASPTKRPNFYFMFKSAQIENMVFASKSING